MSSYTKQPSFLKFTPCTELVKLDHLLNVTNISAGCKFQKASPFLKIIKMSSFTEQPSFLKLMPCSKLMKLDQLVNFTNIGAGCKFQKANPFFKNYQNVVIHKTTSDF